MAGTTGGPEPTDDNWNDVTAVIADRRNGYARKRIEVTVAWWNGVEWKDVEEAISATK